MLTLHSAMLVTLGFLIAALLVVVLLPPYRRRIERFSTEALKQVLPLTEDEIRADKDRLRAEFAMEVHRLETRVEEASLALARQSVEINRRDAMIQDLNQTISAHKMSVEEHENARRVLEQAILDRLPKVEQRLSDTRKLLAARDREIISLTESSAKQAAALEEASQINKQRTDEIYRLKAALDTRAVRNRETVGDPRFDGEVALRTEIEALRATSREQAALIERLQSGTADSEDEKASAAASDELREEVERLKSELTRVEATLLATQDSAGDADEVKAELEARFRDLEARVQDRNAEIVKLRAALGAYETGAASDIADKAEISALKAEVEEQRRTIEQLRAEVVSGSERLARQGQHFRDELRRLGASGGEEGRSAQEAPKLSLAERIVAPKVPQRLPESEEAAGGREARAGGFLKAVNGGPVPVEDVEKEAALADGGPVGADDAPRRSRLLDRISRIEKKS